MTSTTSFSLTSSISPTPALPLSPKPEPTGAPDLAVEILSPGAQKRDRVLKRKVFARSGVAKLWLVQPDQQRIEIHRLQEKREPFQTVESGGEFTSGLFPGLTIDAAEVFAD